MAHKKLKLEVELETAKAKRQAKEIAAEGSSPSSGVAASTPAASRAARQIRELGDAANGAKVNMKEVTRAFAGMAVGMAANYAAKSMKPGAARDAVEYGGAAVTGASMGMIAGPIGAAVGALGGVLKTYLDKSGESKMATEDFMKSEDRYEEARLFQKKMRDLTEVEAAPVGATKKEANADQLKKVGERLAKVREEAVRLFDEQNKVIRETTALLKAGKTEEAKVGQQKLADIRQRKEQMESLERSFERQKKSLDREAEEIAHDEMNSPASRASMTGTDALAKIGAGAASPANAAASASPATTSVRPSGSFGFSVPAHRVSTMTFGNPAGDSVNSAIKTATELSARLQAEMEKTLKEIAENTKGGDAWQ